MRVFVGVSLQLLLCSFFTYAQSPVGFGIISGQVVEAGSTDGLPDAKVTITNASLGFSRTMTTTDDGMFEVTSLNPATGYQIRVARKGFADQLSARGHRPEATIVIASMGNDAGMVGAADLARQ